ncbi:hypothetical protein B2J86_17860 [Acidovorax sp. SRB_14]|uniref:hypothetical protein n=1 Tax=unclassified Acidovorax TaxID=2684926 RepID=UPI00145D5274|nr:MULTISPECIES: hypothetical protein [unclassified Acidovorax]NMM78625.1 hypothetical protein [Acidovorax sp. SRB_24]NMM82757.1 hypothetical protein [Acidovorax sp. SRB_14]NMM92649.1 hypothetical protein [Rhodococcus sp. SRB_17]
MTLIRSLPAALVLLGTPLLASVATAQTTSATDLFASAVDSAALDSYRGGAAQVHSDMALTGTTADNTAQHVNTGSNAISAGAFANMSGIPVVVQNSGANVLIQNAVIVNVQMN